ncbi:endonuclease/exonuclease/phosphatase family protein [Microbacterium sp. Au-Mic1]|uniref:endonuclease/exonuclease/phosphatase family protein n=1 Tax=Microbacterium sp. Au-Mic1 TaxID=2906457 RepID=UPI001E621C28|nr:endonuclease/exonuclease/phosphatase family protein [Microbacterium sp. Au-Mic1]MCE4025258.1 endonuclease/exonuclease/phosphatase family protein [Microbacterium sp. Au-Mic1]
MSQATREPVRTRRAAPRRGAIVALLLSAMALTATVLLGSVPGPLGTAIAVALPWLGLLLVPLVIAALLIRPRTAWIAAVPVVAWTVALWGFLPVPWQGDPSAETSGLLVATQNVEAGSGTGAASARTLAGQGAQILAFTELDGDSGSAIADELAESYPHAYRVGTVGIWSRYPILDEEALDLGLGWKRALRVEIDAPGGPVSVYVVHAASLRPGAQSARDGMLSALGERIRGDRSTRVIALGDFNAVSTDPALASIADALGEVRFGGIGPSFTWPASFPAVRIDHVFQRGFPSASGRTTSAGASDHLAVITALGG